MPNHCMNVLTVTGEDVDAFIAKFEPDNFFQKYLPMPEELENLPSHGDTAYKPRPALFEKYGADNWYEWHLRYWGTKWDAYEIDLIGRLDKTTWKVQFNTAWGPPDQFLVNVGKMFPTLTFALAFTVEGGNGGGHITVRNTTVESDDIDEFEIDEDIENDHYEDDEE